MRKEGLACELVLERGCTPTHILCTRPGVRNFEVQNGYYPAAAHAQSGVKQSVLSVCRQKNIEIRPLRTVYGFKEH